MGEESFNGTSDGDATITRNTEDAKSQRSYKQEDRLGKGNEQTTFYCHF